MTKQFPLLIFVLIFSGFCLAQGSDLEADEIYKQWDESLNTYLLNHSHPYVQTIGLTLSTPNLPGASETDEQVKLNKEQQNYVDHINQLANQDTLSAETTFLLISLCSNHAIRDACHRKKLINRYQQQHPDDLFAYFEVFSQAIDNKDLSMAEYLIKNMRNATYINDMTTLPEVLKTAIGDFMDKYPLPRPVLQKQLKDLVNIDKTVSNKALNQAFYHIRISGIKMALPLPSFRQLMDYCSTESSPTEVCVEVANILITQGNDLISQLIGHSLKVKSYESSFESDLLVKAEDANDQFRKKYECIMKALSNNHHYTDYLDTTYAKIWFTSDNELHRVKSAAHYLFKKGQKAGSSDVIDPTTCDQTSDIPQHP